jgi:regulator of nucleoside diphosphate kinase
MKSHMKPRNIVLSSLDFDRLRDLVATARQFHAGESTILDALDRELGRAQIVPPEEIPPYVVTMNTCVRIIDTDTQDVMRYTLVYPGAADVSQGRLSILSDMGVALLGYSVGDTIEWKFPEGVRRLRIDMCYFQPEATKQYDL